MYYFDVSRPSGLAYYRFIPVIFLSRSAEKLRRSLILITSGATGGYYPPADQPRSGLNGFIVLILNPFRVLAFVLFVIHQFHWWLLKLNPFRISNSN
jgi:hypothetical protein